MQVQLFWHFHDIWARTFNGKFLLAQDPTHLPVQNDPPPPLSCSPTPASQSRKPVNVPLEADPVQMESIGSDPIVTAGNVKTISQFLSSYGKKLYFLKFYYGCKQPPRTLYYQ